MKKKINLKLLILAIALIAGLTLLSSIVLFTLEYLFDEPGWILYLWITLNPIVYFLGDYLLPLLFPHMRIGDLGVILLIDLQYIILVPAFIFLYKWLIKRTKDLGTIVMIIVLIIPILVLLALGESMYSNIPFHFEK